MHIQDEILTAREAAAMMRLSERTLIRLASEGRGPRRVKLTERRIGYIADDVRRWLVSRTEERPADAA